VRRLLVVCPAFVADCLETLEEIGLRGKEAFLENGGEEFVLIPCLNVHPRWIEVLTDWVQSDTMFEDEDSGMIKTFLKVGDRV